ncbi:Os08g0256050 [Oryza sativa Japonica Group]|uniref:Os08g0256050 protein n=1 Tax=Oryza sativa subsp. japonica TaxID=39947 RepID=A0A0P0XDW7_ORYSJ|nr:Os08g0256050 [Oryza sativa Japonica Group]
MAEREGTPASHPVSAVAPPPLAALSPSLRCPRRREKAERHGGRTATSALGQRCARAASLRHVDTLRELGHCL